MKKFLFVLCIFSSVANAEISCEDAGGKLLKGNDKETEYCASYHGMNWWSANAWCQSLGMELVDVQTECNKRTVSIGYTSACPQLKKGTAFSDLQGWAKNTSSPSQALLIHLYTGQMYPAAKNGSYVALCLVK